MTPDQKLDSRAVKAFFDQTDLYLKNEYGIRLRAEIIHAMLNGVNHVSILDIGCGDGSLSRFLAKNNHLTLLDISSNMLDIAREQIPLEYSENVSCINADFMDLTPEGQFDVILCVGVLAHVPSVEKTIGKISDLLVPGGICVLQITDQDQFLAGLIGNVRKLRPVLYSVNKISFRQLIQVASLHQLYAVEKKRYSLLFPGMGILPQKFLYWYQRLSLNHSLLSRWGTELIVKFQKYE